MKKNIFLILALLCAVAQGAWAQTWTEVSTEDALIDAITESANIKLTADIALNNYFKIGSDNNKPTVTLDLAGHTLSRSLTQVDKYGYVILVWAGSTLTVKDSSGDNSGKLTGGWANNGGGIYNSGTLYFQGGTITGCKASSCGGGIANYGTATISGGTISGNESNSLGGGVWNDHNGTLSVTGGTITNNTADGNGGGVFSHSSLSMSGSPSITGNTVGGNANNLYLNDIDTKLNVTGSLNGASIGVTLQIRNRVITSGYHTYNAALDPATVFFADHDGHSLSMDDNEVRYTTAQEVYTNVSTESELNSAITDGANIKLTADIALTNCFIIGDGNNNMPTVTLDLAGHTLSRSLTQAVNNGYVIYVRTGSALIVKDSSGNNSGKLTGGWGNTAGGIYNSGTLCFQGGTITDCQSKYAGGGINNAANASLTISGGAITGNYAKTQGGGINNSGIALTITGCSITNNTADGKGGGVYYNSGVYNDHLNISGNLVITGNTAGGSKSNLCLDGESSIAICGTFTAGTSIGVTLTSYNNVFTSGYTANNPGAKATDYFSADLDGAALTLDGGEAMLYVGEITEYIEHYWDGDDTSGRVANRTKNVFNVNKFTSSSSKTVGDGWYLLSGSFTYNNRLTIDGDVKFILEDGCDVEFKKGINIKQDKTLTIYRQQLNKGRLTATGCGGSENAAIGGNEGEMGGHLAIHGCTIEAYVNEMNCAAIGGGDGENSGMQSVTIWDGTVIAKGNGNTTSGFNSGPGIGGGQENKTANCPTVRIYGGTVKATGGTYAAGIGGGEECSGGPLYIYGGTVKATGGYYGPGIGSGETADIEQPIYIYGGKVTATGGMGGAGIGCTEDGNVENSIYIYGGTINATGGDHGAGIGGGDGANVLMDLVTLVTSVTAEYGHVNAPVYIYGGNVTATGGVDAAGIGGGYRGDVNSTIYIYDGTVNATGGSGGAGIGGGECGDSGSVEIYAGTVTATGSDSGAGIGGGYSGNMNGSVYIYGGEVTATGGLSEMYESDGGAGIGGGYEGDMDGDVYIYDGTVTATGNGHSAGIGGGNEGSQNGTVTVRGGTVTATGAEYGAGIGGGGSYSDKGGNGGPVKIYGGTVTATGGSGGAGIGGSYSAHSGGGNGGTVEIHGGKVYATGGKMGAGIGGGCYGDGGGTLTVDGGYVEATSVGGSGAAIGGGYYCDGGTVTITGGTVKAIFDQLDNDISHGVYIGYGGFSYSNSYDMGILTLGSDMMVSKDGTNSATADRVSACQSHTDVSSTLTVTACDHSSITGYTSTDDYYHHFDCQYCEGGDEHHTKGDGDACVQCGHNLPTHAYTLYEANAGGTGYATEGTAYYVTATREFTFPECSVVPNKMVFAGWLLSDTAPSGLITESTEDLIQADSTITIPMEAEDRTYYARYTEVYFSGGEGSVSDPFRISDEEDWNRLADAVKDGVTFSGMYFLLTNDISVTTMVGKDKNRFQGRFDGNGKTITFNVTATEDYCAPFCRISGATIKNLNTTGTIETSGRYAAGVVAYTRYYSTIENCHSSVTIRSSHAGWAGHGGILGLKADVSYSKPTIEGCVFEGKILSTGATATTGGGGIVGLTNGQTLTIKNCLYKPAALETGETAVAVSTIYANSSTYPSTVTCTDCYYTEAYGSAESGTRGYTVTSGSDGLTLDYGTATTSYAYGGVKVYSFDQGNSTTLGGLLYGAMVNGQSSMVNTLYTSGTAEVTFTALMDNGQKITSLAATSGTLANNGDGSYKLTMASTDATVIAMLANYAVALYDAPGTNDPTNATTIDEHNGQITDVTISGRTLFKDDSWNTLCLPFDVTAKHIEAKDGDNNYITPFHGATIMELDVDGKYDADGSPVENGAYQTGFKDSTLYLYFREVTQMEAGKPYIVRWARDTDVTDPAFGYCRMMSTAAETVTSADGKVSFKGIYDPMTLNGGDASNLYLGAGNQLYYPSENRTMNAFRAYFHVDLGTTSAVRAFSLHFGDEDGNTTGIIEAEANSSLFILHSSLSGWHSLEGRKLSGKPTAKGVYIYNGKKRVIK